MIDKVTRQCPQTTTFLKLRRAEAVSNRGPSAYQPNALPLGQTGSPRDERFTMAFIALLSASGQTHCALVLRNAERVTAALPSFFLTSTEVATALFCCYHVIWTQRNTCLHAAGTDGTASESSEQLRATWATSVSPCQLQALLYNIPPPTTALTDYTMGLRKWAANGHFSVGAQMEISL